MKKITVSPGFFISIAVSFMIIPIPWVVSWIAAAAFHEFFHILALNLCGYPVYAVQIGATGAKIDSNLQPGYKMALCAMAGPLAGLFLLLFLRSFPKIAICGVVQSIGNLIPLLPLDGGRVVCGVLYHIFTAYTADRIIKVIEFCVSVFLMAAGVYCVVHLKLGILPLAVVTVFLIRKKALAKKCSSEYNRDNRL